MTKSEYDSLALKVQAVIFRCKTVEQLNLAVNYCNLASAIVHKEMVFKYQDFSKIIAKMVNVQEFRVDERLNASIKRVYGVVGDEPPKGDRNE